MDRFFQMTFLPHIENTWNFFFWVTDRDGTALPFPESSTLPSWLSETSDYPTYPYTATFIDGKQDHEVDGIIMPMAHAFRLIRSGVLQPEQTNSFNPGLTVQWFRQISEAVDSLLENGLFYPFFYHLRRGKDEQCYFSTWIPDAEPLHESGLFSDWLGRLPRLAVSIDELQDQKVQQWLYLIVIYWVNALIREVRIEKGQTDRLISTQDQNADKASARDDLLPSNEKAWKITRDPEMIETLDRLEFELAGWVQPVATPSAHAWIQALLALKRKQMDAYFAPENAEIALHPIDPHDLFSPGAQWNYSISLTGWQSGRRTVRIPENDPLSSLNESSWLAKQLTSIQAKLPASLISLLKRAYTGTMTVGEISELYQNEELLKRVSIHVVFPNDLEIHDASDVSVDLDIEQKKSPGESSLFGLNALISYNWRIAVGDLEFSSEEFATLVRANQPFIHHGNQWIHLPVKQMIKAYAEMEDALDLLNQRANVSTAMKIEAARRRKRKPSIKVHLNSELDNYLSHLFKRPSRAIALPNSFVGKLRPYQQKGYTWLVHLRHQNVGGCLADDMGLGKTVQAIAYLDYCKQNPAQPSPDQTAKRGPSLIICPTSLVANWSHECATFSPSLDVYIHHGTNRLHGRALDQRLQTCDVMITSYAIYTKEAEQLAYEWNCCILDEAQAIKNPHAQKTRALRHVKTVHRLVLTGTPIENRLEELWSIMEFLNPGYLGSLDRFRARFIQPIEKKNNRSKATQLTRMIQPFLLRREKSDKRIIRDLPEKIEAKRVCNLTKNQASLYQSVVDGLKQNVGDTGGIKRKGLILSTLTRLKQVCDHPELVSDLDPAAGGTSGKMELLFDILDPLFDQNEKVLLFTQYVKMGRILVDKVQQKYPDAAVYFLHGSLSSHQRQQLITDFQNKEKRKTLFILSLKAGGVGLNLTEAGYVIHYDRWWNPAVEEQATDRAYRIGQKHNVYVYKLICEGTLEERIDLLIERKKGLQKQVLSGGEGWLTEMSDQELFDLIQLHEGVV